MALQLPAEALSEALPAASVPLRAAAAASADHPALTAAPRAAAAPRQDSPILQAVIQALHPLILPAAVIQYQAPADNYSTNISYKDTK